MMLIMNQPSKNDADSVCPPRVPLCPAIRGVNGVSPPLIEGGCVRAWPFNWSHALFLRREHGRDVIPDGIGFCWWCDSIKMLPRWGTRIEAAIRLARPVRCRFIHTLTGEAERY